MRRVKQNIWGNWKGYEGRRKVIDFGTDEHAAHDWASTGDHEFHPHADDPPKKISSIDLRGNQVSTTPYGGCP